MFGGLKAAKVFRKHNFASAGQLAWPVSVETVMSGSTLHMHIIIFAAKWPYAGETKY